MENRMTQERFLRDAKDLQLHVQLGNDVYRHILMKKPGCSAYHYSIVTFPGFLVMTGDMGAWTFQRLHDMFEFFRKGIKQDGTIRTNLGYWSEKLVAVDGNRNQAGCKEWDQEEFRRVVCEHRLRMVRDEDGRELTKEQRRELWEAIDDDVLSKAEDEGAAMNAAVEFSWGPKYNGPRPFYFSDFWEHDCKRYTSAFEWACFAIPHAIQMYDAHKEATKPPAPAPAPVGEDDGYPF